MGYTSVEGIPDPPFGWPIEGYGLPMTASRTCLQWCFLILAWLELQLQWLFVSPAALSEIESKKDISYLFVSSFHQPIKGYWSHHQRIDID
jgi:hypothetical protein